MMWPALIAFVAAFLFITGLGSLLLLRKKQSRKFSRTVSPAVDADLLRGVAPSLGSRIEKLLKPFHQLLPRNSQEVSTIQRRLARAGYRETSWVNVFYSARLVVPGLLCVLATVTGLYEYSPLFVYGLAAGLGFLVPDYWVSSRISERQMKLRLGLPDALDLIVICVEAGLTMDRATMRASEEMRGSQPAIADELNLVYLEQRAGRPRAEAWKHLAERTEVDTIRSMTSILIQADKFGTSIGKTLRVYSETLRIRRRQEVEELAAKTTVKLVFPLVLLIFPSLFLVILGPSMILIMEGFSEFFS
jgi:tight adherence protein C